MKRIIVTITIIIIVVISVIVIVINGVPHSEELSLPRFFVNRLDPELVSRLRVARNYIIGFRTLDPPPLYK